ncbi:Hypothetical predicted protein [Mytilus galloprovincialis]|uniref:Uncharacterized protein n=1 Tax=Mytilus galloprovincialis TaxID=29158 RepID=A0A8B6BS38_MYTGA|nr:Hypothetical predicted protein [Mytilus galloprovincialis]
MPLSDVFDIKFDLEIKKVSKTDVVAMKSWIENYRPIRQRSVRDSLYWNQDIQNRGHIEFRISNEVRVTEETMNKPNEILVDEILMTPIIQMNMTHPAVVMIAMIHRNKLKMKTLVISEAPYEFMDAPYELRDAPYELRDAPYELWDASDEFRDAPHELRAVPYEMMDLPNEMMHK